MPTHSPVEFNRWVQVPAGEEKYEPCTLSNDYAQNELFQLRISEDSTPGEVVARVPVAVRQQETLELSVRAPEDSEPGVFPFTVIADLESRNLRLSMPGLRVVPPLGGWKAELQPGAELKTRPWQKGAPATIELTNQSNDWLYCDIQILNTNNAWDYRLTSRRVCLPPWVDANRKHGAANTNLTAALISGASTKEDRPLAPVPTKSVRLVARPKKKRWFGAMPEGTGETNVTLKISRLNPETGGAATHIEQPLRVVYQPIQSPAGVFDALRAFFQRVGAFLRWAFSMRGMFSLAGIGAAIWVLWGAPVSHLYDIRDRLYPASVDQVVVSDDAHNQGITFATRKSLSVSFKPQNAEAIRVAIPALNLDQVTEDLEHPVSLPPFDKAGDYELRVEPYHTRKDKLFEKARREMKPGHQVSLTLRITADPVRLPSYVNQPFEAAKASAQSMGITLTPELQKVEGIPEGVILAQRTSPNTKVTPPTTVTVVVNGLIPGGNGQGGNGQGGNGQGGNGQGGNGQGGNGQGGNGQGTVEARIINLGGGGDAFVELANKALEGASGTSQVAIVGPGPATRPLRRDTALVGIGEGGARFLEKLPRSYFHYDGDLLTSSIDANPSGFDALGAGQVTGNLDWGGERRSIPVISESHLGLVPQGAHELFTAWDHTHGRSVVAGWRGKRGYWGVVDIEGTQLTEYFKQFVKRIAAGG